MRPADPFTPFPARGRKPARPLVSWQSKPSQMDDFLDAPDRAALHARFAPDRARLFGLLTILVASLFVVRLIDLQLVHGATYRDRAESNRVKREVLPAPRGILFDRHGAALTRNEPDFLLSLNPAEWPTDATDRADLIDAVAATSRLERSVLDAALADPAADGTVTLRGQLTKDAAIALQSAFRGVAGISVTAAAARTYPLGTAGSHLLGYVGRPADDDLAAGYATTDVVGRSGLESYYEQLLRGQNGVQEVERNSANQTQRVIAARPPTPGHDLTLTIDAGLQTRLAASLDDMLRRTHAPGGAAVALDPRTGDVLALVSAPGFDPTSLSRGLSADAYRTLIEDQRQPLFNRAVSGEYPSGSTIKPFIAAAALEEKIVTPSTVIQSSGGLRVGQWFFPDWKSGGHGPTNLTTALAESVNTYFYTIGGGYEGFQGLGIERMTRYAERFGFGRTLGLDLGGERPGFLPSMDWKERTKGESWYVGDTYHFAIGQGDLLVTPLQLAVGTAAIANGGTVYRPRLTAAEAGRTREPEPLATGIVSERSLAAVRNGMRETVLSGSARALADLSVTSAGKTGSAQFGPSDATHAWFTAFAPYETPTIALAILIERGGEGHAAALPVARDALSWYFTNR